MDALPHISAFALAVLAESLCERVVSHSSDGRKGGYFCVADLEGTPRLVCRVGAPEKDKVEKFYTLAIEKPRRLSVHPEHLSSWESRMPDAGQWGGAIRLEKALLSFSGFPELLDEAFMLIIALQKKHLSLERAQKIAHISANPYFEILHKQFL